MTQQMHGTFYGKEKSQNVLANPAPNSPFARCPGHGSPTQFTLLSLAHLSPRNQPKPHGRQHH